MSFKQLFHRNTKFKYMDEEEPSPSPACDEHMWQSMDLEIRELFDVETDAGHFYVVAQDFEDVERIIESEFNQVEVLSMKQLTGKPRLSILIPGGNDYR